MTMRRISIAALVFAAVVFGPAVFAEGPFRQWESVGPGGGGGNFRAAVSPHDTKLYFAACDMGGFYRSADAGANWRMIDGIAHTTIPVVFDPVDPDACYVAHGIGRFLTNGWAISKSEDKGRTWKRLYGFIGAYSTNAIRCLAINPDNTSEMFAGTGGAKPGRILKSATGGHFWRASDEGIPEDTTVLGIYYLEPAEPRAAIASSRPLLAVTGSGVYRSGDGGRTWQPSNTGLAPDAGCIACSQAKDDVIYVATAVAKEADGKLVGGLYRTDDGGRNWQRAASPVDVVFESSGGARLGRMTAVAANAARPELIRAAMVVPGDPPRSGVWESADGGATWRYLLMGDAAGNLLGEARGVGSNVETGWLTREFSWWWGDTPKNADQLTVCASDPDIILRQDDGRTIGTRDGGKTWRQLYTDHAGDNRWTSRGYEVTTCYKVYRNPNDHDRMFIAYTDIGFFRSEDRGASWIYSLRGARHTNTVYDLAIDPAKPERMFAATSGSHDQPYWKTLVPDRNYSRGGVAMTEDGGASWVNLGEATGLPNASCGSIILDPESPVDSRTLYVTSWGQGVYKSEDSGGTWRRVDGGIDTETDYNFWRMARAADGTLYLVTTKIIEVADGRYSFSSGALYRSEDGAETWQRVAKGDWIAYPWDVVCDPVDPEVIYVASKSDPHVITGQITPGGVYRSRDRGRTWQRILENLAPQRITIDPNDTDILYVGTEYDGVCRSADGGKVWAKLAGLPFKNAFGVSIDPDDADTIYVTTFGGGVWRGSVYGSGGETTIW